MAYVKKNIVTEGLSGKLGNSIVFRNVGGKTVVAVKPDTSQRKDSEAQKQHQRKFRAGASYAKQAAQDPVMREAYGLRAKPGQSPYNVALADYLNAPEIEAVDLRFFTGAKGSPVVMQVMDDHEVTEVKVAIYDPQGGLVEEGNATLHENGTEWVYTTQKALATVSGSSVYIQASDLPGNTIAREEVTQLKSEPSPNRLRAPGTVPLAMYLYTMQLIRPIPGRIFLLAGKAFIPAILPIDYC